MLSRRSATILIGVISKKDFDLLTSSDLDLDLGPKTNRLVRGLGYVQIS